jgi:hypothetical protein
MHKAVIQVESPNDVEMRLTIRASVGTLRNVEKAISHALSERWDGRTGSFLSSIREAIRIVDTSFVGMARDDRDD